MPWESIGSTSTGQIPDDEDWIVFSLELAMHYVQFVRGPPPTGCKLGVTWRDHDLGSYPLLGVWYELSQPGEYVSACESALEALDDAVDWQALRAHRDALLDSAESDEDRIGDDDG